MKANLIIMLFAAFLVIVSATTVPVVRKDFAASCNATNADETWSTIPISDNMKHKCAEGFFCKEASDILFDCYEFRYNFGVGMHECLCGSLDWKTWVLDCTACISENLPADVPNNPKGLTNATVAIIGEYCKLPPNLETPTQELAFYGDMLTTRYWSPIRFFTFITLWSPICSAESILRHESLKRAAAPAIELEKKESDVAVRAAADPSHIYDCIFDQPGGRPECPTAGSYFKTCSDIFPRAHNTVPSDPAYWEHVWNCFCRLQGPEIGIGGGGYFGPWAGNSSACDACINSLHNDTNTIDSHPHIQRYCSLQSDFWAAYAEMVARAEHASFIHGGVPRLLNYSIGIEPLYDTIPTIPFNTKRDSVADKSIESEKEGTAPVDLKRAPQESIYECVLRSPECNAARSYYKTCFYKWVEAHNSIPNSPEGLEHAWNCFCRLQGPEIGIGGGGYFGPWAQNASACDTCVNNVLHTTFDSRPIIQKYCNIQIGRFQEAVLEMIKQAENETASQGFSGFPHLLNYTLGSPGIPAFEDIPDIPF